MKASTATRSSILCLSRNHTGPRPKTFAALAIAAALLACLPTQSSQAVVSWTGTSSTLWATGSNWSNNAGPSTSDTVSFTGTGSSTIPGEVTSILNADRSIAGLTFNNTATQFHTLDVATHTLTVTGNLNFNVDQSAASTTTLRNGILIVNSQFSNINVGRAVSGTGNGTADLTGLTSLSATLQDIQVGTSTANAATGTLRLPNLATINAQRVLVGIGGNNNATAKGTLNFGNSTTLVTGQFIIGQDYASGTAKITPGGTLNLGTSGQRTSLQLANSNINTDNLFTATLDLTGATFNAYLSDLIVGQRVTAGGFGGFNATLLGGNAGAIDIGAPGNTANLYVGRGLGGSATGSADLSGLATLNSSLNALSVGNGIAGSGNGTLSLPVTSTINANSITVGAGVNDSNGTLTLGRSNTILTSQVTVGQDYASGKILVPSNASLTLGSSSQRAAIVVGAGNTNTDNSYVGRFDLTGAAFNGYLADVTVGQKQGGSFGNATGTFIAGASGSVNIGAPGNTANLYVGRMLTNGGSASATGTADFSGLSSLSASLNAITVGTSQSGHATGTLNFAQSNNISANSITVGSGAGDSNGTLTLGRSNTILTNQLTIGQDYASGTVTIPANSSVILGSSSQRTSAYIGIGNTITNNLYTGKLDLTGASLTAFLDQLIVGQKDGGGFGNTTGTFIAGNSGSINIGAPGNTANLIVAQMLSNGGSASTTGNADFSGLSSLTASLNTLSVGTSLSGGATGTLKLAQSNNISALNIIVGSSGNSSNSIVLGMTNVITANQLTISKDYASATVTIPSGGSLTLGSPAQRTSISIATGNTNTNTTYTGTLDLTNATFIAYLDNVIVGDKNPLSGAEIGIFTISSNPNNYINANAITLGGDHSTGTLNFGGGALYAGSIAKGIGTATFNWIGGQLSVGSFGTPALNFNLANTGTGTLFPGAASGAIGTANIYGNYTQGSAAAMSIRIAGTTPGTGNDFVAVSGSATLAGTLNLSILNNFAPVVGQNLQIATYASRTGTFGFVAPPHLPQNVAFQLEYAPTQLLIHMVNPTAQNWISSASTGTFGTAANWDTNSTPVTTSALTITNSAASPKTVTVNASTTVHRLSLSATVSTLNFEVPQGINFGVANDLVVGTNATLTGGGHVFGNVVITGGLVAPSESPNTATTLTVNNLSTSPSGTLSFNLVSPGTNDSLVITNPGGLTLNGGALKLNDSSAPQGYYKIIQYTGPISGTGLASLSIATPAPAGQAYLLDTLHDPGFIDIHKVLIGDVNQDNIVDGSDFDTWFTHLLTSTHDYAAGDLNQDGLVDGADFDLWFTHLLNSFGNDSQLSNFQSQISNPTSVPEPASMALLGLGAASFLGRRRVRP